MKIVVLDGYTENPGDLSWEGLEALGELTGLNPGELATLLVGLELAGAVRQLPGNRYMKL